MTCRVQNLLPPGFEPELEVGRKAECVTGVSIFFLGRSTTRSVVFGRKWRCYCGSRS